MDFTDKTVIATGAASGMGLLFAQNIAASGANVVMCDINKNVLDEKVRAINEKHQGSAVGIVCDVRDYSQVYNAVGKTVELFSKIDILANFAGGTAVRMRNVNSKEFP